MKDLIRYLISQGTQRIQYITEVELDLKWYQLLKPITSMTQIELKEILVISNIGACAPTNLTSLQLITLGWLIVPAPVE